jgi:GrpB-like predicted nucleotidyltransferase (UPF0157 family)
VTKKPESDEEMASIRVTGTVSPHNAQIYLAPYDRDWPVQYEAEAAKIRAALGEAAIVLEHVGSTSITGLCAKPIIDILLCVANSANEEAYAPALTAQGYRLHLREPDWEQHRVMKGEWPLVNLHVFTAGSPEVVRMLAFRDRCRTHPDELMLYQETKRALAGQVWRHVQHYANAKGEVVEAIIARALVDAPAGPPSRKSRPAGSTPAGRQVERAEGGGQRPVLGSGGGRERGWPRPPAGRYWNG